MFLPCFWVVELVGVAKAHSCPQPCKAWWYQQQWPGSSHCPLDELLSGLRQQLASGHAVFGQRHDHVGDTRSGDVVGSPRSQFEPHAHWEM